MGVETEFGCLVADDSLGTPEQAVEAIKDYLFFELKIGAIDVHARDEVFEPAQSGGFLLNGGRLYIDAVGSHLEYATAESRDFKTLIAHDRAGHRLIVRAIRELGLQGKVSVYNNSVDHFGGHTFGCHENYLMRIDEDFFGGRAAQLYPFLITRQIFAGVGRVGGHYLSAAAVRPSYQEIMDNPIDYIWVSQVYGVYPDDRVQYQLSQRSDHIIKTVASRVRFNRALINPKWEHFYSHDRMQRLHLLFGESNMMEYAFALKVGTTSLVLRLLEDEIVPTEVALAQPLAALREVSRDPTLKWKTRLADGTEESATNLQRRYLELAQRYAGDNPDTDWTLTEWAKTLDDLDRDPLTMGDRLDWVAKRQMVEAYMAEEELDWTADALHSVDLEYHNIDPELGLFYALQESGQTRRVLDELDIVDAMTEPPENTRAKGRAALVQQVLNRKGPRYYMFDWNGVALDRKTYVDMPNPFETYATPEDLVGE